MPDCNFGCGANRARRLHLTCCCYLRYLVRVTLANPRKYRAKQVCIASNTANYNETPRCLFSSSFLVPLFAAWISHCAAICNTWWGLHAFSMPVRETKIDISFVHRGSFLVCSLFPLPTIFFTHTQDLFTEISQNVGGARWGQMLHRGIEATGFVVYCVSPETLMPHI